MREKVHSGHSARIWPACHAPVKGRSGQNTWRHSVLKGNVKLCPRIPALPHRLSWQPFYLSLCFHSLFSPIYFPYALEGSYKTQIWSSIFHSVLNSPFFLVDKKLNSFTDYAKSFMILPLPVHSASIFLILTPDFIIMVYLYWTFTIFWALFQLFLNINSFNPNNSMRQILLPAPTFHIWRNWGTRGKDPKCQV